MYRDRIEELRKEKGLSCKQLSEMSGVSLDTLSRIQHPENPEKDSPRINTLADICKVFGIELWELFYTGSTSLVALQAEITTLKSERDSLIADLAVQKEKNERLSLKVDSLKDQIIDILMKVRDNIS
jgi:transcriptional regulator with XRE-family HTH domain